MKFAHLADCHVGGWREPRLRDLGIKSFFSALDISIEKGADFVLISGDLFNTSFPAIDDLKAVVKKLKELKDRGIPVYLIAGSHDFSPLGKTILDVLEEAELSINVMKGDREETKKLGKLVLKFTVDRKTGAKITGMLGKRGMLERTYYEELYRENLEKEPGFKIFMFHSAITELKPKEMEKMDSAPVSLLPKGFDYYAGGHVHIVREMSLPGYRNIVYPGPVFPNNFTELEKLQGGSFFFYDNGALEQVKLNLFGVLSVSVNADHKNPQQVEREILDKADENVSGKIVLIRASGLLDSGRTTDIDFRKIFSAYYEKGAYYVMRNAVHLSSREFEEVKVESSSIEDIEDSLIKEHLGKIKVPSWDNEQELEITKRLLRALDSEKKDGEKVYEFEERLRKEISKLLDTE